MCFNFRLSSLLSLQVTSGIERKLHSYFCINYDAVFVAVKECGYCILKNIITFFCCIICLVQEDLVCFGLAGWSWNVVVFVGILQYLNVTDCQGFLDHQYTFHVQSCIMTADCFLHLELVFTLTAVEMRIRMRTSVPDFSRRDGTGRTAFVPSRPGF